MAEGKNIEIKIAATGGEAAAAEVRKVEEAAKSVAKSVAPTKFNNDPNPMGGMLDGVAKVSAANVRMGRGMQNVGSQVQDFAVKIGSGTSVLRAMGQQLPQLLSGFGPLGIALGGVSTIALPLAAAMFNLGSATADAGREAEAAAEKFKTLTDQRTARAAAAGLKENKAWIDALDDEEAAITRGNEALKRSIELIHARRVAQTEIQDAQAALDLAKVDADGGLSDADKIEARAGIQAALERKKFEGRKADAGERVTLASNQSDEAGGLSERKASDAEITRARLAAQEAEMQRLKRIVTAADSAKNQIPALQAQENDARTVGFAAAADGSFSKQEMAKLNEDYQAKFRAREAAEAASREATEKERQGLEKLRGKKDDETGQFKGGEIDQTKQALEDLTASATKLSIAAAKAKADAAAIFEKETVGVAGDYRATDLKLQASKITSDSGASKSREAEQARKKAEAATLEKERLQEARKQTEAELKIQAGSNKERVVGSAGRANNRAAADALKSLGKDIGSADTDAEIKAVRDKIAASQQVLGTSIVSAMQKMLDGQNALVQKVQALEGQIKNKR